MAAPARKHRNYTPSAEIIEFQANGGNVSGTEIIEFKWNTNNNEETKDSPTKRKSHRSGKKSEVYCLQIDDLHNLVHYFFDNEMWPQYLAFVLSCNIARRAGDILTLKWEDLFDPNTGKLRAKCEIWEDKTDKFAAPYINDVIRKEILLYIEKTGIDPAGKNPDVPDSGPYSDWVFRQVSGTYKGRKMSYSGYMASLKKAAEKVGITYNIGTHSPRKTFGYISRMIHPNDPHSMVLLQEIFNHSDEKTTHRYIGLTEEQAERYYQDYGRFFSNHILGDQEFNKEKNSIVVTLETNDIRDIIRMAYERGKENANDSSSDWDVCAELMEMVEAFAK